MFDLIFSFIVFSIICYQWIRISSLKKKLGVSLAAVGHGTNRNDTLKNKLDKLERDISNFKNISETKAISEPAYSSATPSLRNTGGKSKTQRNTSSRPVSDYRRSTRDNDDHIFSNASVGLTSLYSDDTSHSSNRYDPSPSCSSGSSGYSSYSSDSSSSSSSSCGGSSGGGGGGGD